MNPNKETIMNLIVKVDNHGIERYHCPRCGHRRTNNILDIQYCSRCGQHIAPFLSNRRVDEVTKVRESLTISDLKKKKE